jgi:hypothetical protein
MRWANRVLAHFEATPKAFANSSPGLERSDNPRVDNAAYIQP